MEELYLPTLHYFENKNRFSGSDGPLRFMLTPNVVMRNAKERGHGSSGLAAVLLEEYNGRKRNPAGRLAVSKLMAGV